MNTVTVSFPGLGIENFTLNKIAFTLFGISVRWYGILITLGIVIAFFYTYFRTKQQKIILDDLLDIAIFLVIFGIIGARLYYVLMKLEDYHSFYDVIAIWNGGLAIYGGLIGGAVATFFVCRHKKINFMTFADCCFPGVMIAQALGRWGNFFNGEAHGGIVEEGSVLYFLRMGLYPHHVPGVSGMAFVHPTFFYESLWNVIGFILINIFYKKKSFEGEVALWYIAWYGFGRMFVEGLRTDSLMIGNFRVSQVVGLLCFLAGAGTILWLRIRNYKKNKNITED